MRSQNRLGEFYTRIILINEPISHRVLQPGIAFLSDVAVRANVRLSTQAYR
jgi:hypothetical protein